MSALGLVIFCSVVFVLFLAGIIGLLVFLVVRVGERFEPVSRFRDDHEREMQWGALVYQGERPIRMRLDEEEE